MNIDLYKLILYTFISLKPRNVFKYYLKLCFHVLENPLHLCKKYWAASVRTSRLYEQQRHLVNFKLEARSLPVSFTQ